MKKLKENNCLRSLDFYLTDSLLPKRILKDARRQSLTFDCKSSPDHRRSQANNKEFQQINFYGSLALSNAFCSEREPNR